MRKQSLKPGFEQFWIEEYVEPSIIGGVPFEAIQRTDRRGKG